MSAKVLSSFYLELSSVGPLEKRQLEGRGIATRKRLVIQQIKILAASKLEIKDLEASDL